jgi:hypothetical protein
VTICSAEVSPAFPVCGPGCVICRRIASKEDFQPPLSAGMRKARSSSSLVAPGR